MSIHSEESTYRCTAEGEGRMDHPPGQTYNRKLDCRKSFLPRLRQPLFVNINSSSKSRSIDQPSRSLTRPRREDPLWMGLTQNSTIDIFTKPEEPGFLPTVPITPLSLAPSKSPIDVNKIKPPSLGSRLSRRREPGRKGPLRLQKPRASVLGGMKARPVGEVSAGFWVERLCPFKQYCSSQDGIIPALPRNPSLSLEEVSIYSSEFPGKQAPSSPCLSLREETGREIPLWLPSFETYQAEGLLERATKTREIDSTLQPNKKSVEKFMIKEQEKSLPVRYVFVKRKKKSAMMDKSTNINILDTFLKKPHQA